MKKIISIFVFIFLFIFTIIPVFGSRALVTPYGSVTEDTSQIKILIAAMHNNVEYQFFDSDWFALRSGQYRYDLYYNIDYDEQVASCYSYIGTQSNNGTIWTLVFDSEVEIPHLNYSTYTIVGNVENCLASHSDIEFRFQHIIEPLIFFSAIVIVYFVFRVKKRGIS